MIDLETGDQPIASEDGTVVVVLNGEIYNYRELRGKLESRGHRFATNGDTETIVHLYEEHGRDCVRHLHGMFAFALWDARRRRLLIGADRVGKKPLFYAVDGARLSFASELQALLEDEAVSREVDLRQSIAISPTATSRLLRSAFRAVQETSACAHAGVAGRPCGSSTGTGHSTTADKLAGLSEERGLRADPECRAGARPGGGWSPTSLSARFSRAGSTPRRWSQRWRRRPPPP